MKQSFGGKANSLIQLKGKWNVPDFFIISKKEYEQFLEENNLKDKMMKRLKQKKYKEIKELINQASIPTSLLEKIQQKWKEKNFTLVAVRSSATKEDGEHKSFAGQYETVLNVTIEKIEQAIKTCWCSLYKENVIDYASEMDSYGMNVIIQKMISSDYAGVAFSKDITSTTGNYSVVEVLEGLGENLVSGIKTPTKVLIRRETKYPDLILGTCQLKTETIARLEAIILEVEKHFQKPMDIEFAIVKDEIYLLQARPITAFSTIPVPYSLTITRPYSLIEEELFYQGEYNGIKKMTRNLYYFKPMFIYQKELDNVAVYYNELDLEEDPTMMYYYINEDLEKLEKCQKQIIEYCHSLTEIIKQKKSIEISSFLNKIIEIIPWISLGQLAGHWKNIPRRVKKLFISFREKYDTIVHRSIDYLLEQLEKELPMELKKDLNFISLEEFTTHCYPSKEEIEKRKKGYIYFEKLHVTENRTAWLKNQNKWIKEDEKIKKQGQMAYPGKRIGKVCKVFSEKDLKKFQKGNILVTPMTVPKFISIMKQASAIITDEGGTTCHAAILARELKIPCIVGCKNATKQLNDGDMIEVNGELASYKKISEKKDLQS